MQVYGINAVAEALRAGRAARILVSERNEGRIAEILALANRDGIRVERVSPDVLDRATGGRPHQGVAADVESPHDYSVEELVRQAASVPLILVLDGIEDPQNLGAILRTADAAGVDGVIRQTRHAARLGPAAARASAGAFAHVRIAPVVNIARAIDELKDMGVWIVGLAAEADRRHSDIDLTLPTALVLGSEGTGLRRLVREKCDWLAAIPMEGRISSLNVSVAAGVVLFEAVRQRRAASRSTDRR
jgi:23S rRNA (guanosine2251-2'-O)-methyltransferase